MGCTPLCSHSFPLLSHLQTSLWDTLTLGQHSWGGRGIQPYKSKGNLILNRYSPGVILLPLGHLPLARTAQQNGCTVGQDQAFSNPRAILLYKQGYTNTYIQMCCKRQIGRCLTLSRCISQHVLGLFLIFITPT